MRSTARRILVLLSLFVIVAFVVSLVNQTAQVVALAERVSPLAGQALFWLLIFVYAGCLLVPVWLFLRLPRPLTPPASEDETEVAAHVARLAARLRKNPLLEGRPLDSRQEV